MIRSISVVLVLVSLAITAPAQCLGFGGPCAGGSTIQCANPPRIGTNWRVCPTQDIAGVGHFMLIGGCSRGRVLGSPPACTSCNGCSLHVPSPLVAVPWRSCFQLSIPNDGGLIGLQLCVQDAAVRTGNCLCLSNAITVRVMP